MSAKRLDRVYKNYIFGVNILYVWYLNGKSYNYLPKTMMNKLDYYGMVGAQELFTEIQSAIGEYSSKPSERLFLFLVFSLNHLREWIAGSSYNAIKNKKDSGAPLTKEEQFFYEIWDLEEFKIINGLCNRGKHYLVSNDKLKTSKTNGLQCGLSQCGDALGQEYFLIDGADSRDILFPVIRKYYLWFEANG